MPRGDHFRKMWRDDPERMRFWAKKGLRSLEEGSRSRAGTLPRRLRSMQASSVKNRRVPVSLAPVRLED